MPAHQYCVLMRPPCRILAGKISQQSLLLPQMHMISQVQVSDLCPSQKQNLSSPHLLNRWMRLPPSNTPTYTEAAKQMLGNQRKGQSPPSGRVCDPSLDSLHISLPQQHHSTCVIHSLMPACVHASFTQ